MISSTNSQFDVRSMDRRKGMIAERNVAVLNRSLCLLVAIVDVVNPAVSTGASIKRLIKRFFYRDIKLAV